MKQEALSKLLNYHIYSILSDKQNNKTLTYILLTNADSKHVESAIHKYISLNKPLKIFAIKSCTNPKYNKHHNSFTILKQFANTQFNDANNILNALYIINTCKQTCQHTYNRIVIKQLIDNLIKTKNKVLPPCRFITPDEFNDLNKTRVYQHQHLEFYKKENNYEN